MDSYLTFDEAVVFLKTNTSTLYKWLQSGKVPAHKLGRQWRFVREELESWLLGKGETTDGGESARSLAAFFAGRHENVSPDEIDPVRLLHNLVYDAVHHHASAIHLSFVKGVYQIAYRIDGKLNPVITLSEELFSQIDRIFVDMSFPLQNEYARSAYLQKKNDHDASTQIIYQKINTLTGAHVTLKMTPDHLELPSLQHVAEDKNSQATFSKWLEWNSGIIIVSGMLGHGMTTTVGAFLNHIRHQGKKVFLVQDSSESLFSELNPVEVIADDEASFVQTMTHIMASDADAIGVTIEPASDLEPILFKAAYRAASKGHIVIMQYNATSCDAVLEKIKAYAPDILTNHIKAGISHQTLVSIAKEKRKAEYVLLELPS